VTEVHDGDLCSVVDNDMFRVAKVLRVGASAVHVRLYAERFLTRPVALKPGELTLGSVQDQVFGIGHLPLARDEFERWEPIVFAHEPVAPDELEGYDLWAEAAAEGAGLWGGASERSFADRLRSLFGRRAR
jgi:hypothetical protein